MNISICSMIKDEQAYLDEWIKFHLSIGFDDIYLFEDFGSMSHQEICKNYENVHLIKVEDLKPKIPFDNRQFLTLNNFIKKFYKKTDWAAFIDVDEFVILDECNDIHDFLQEYKDEYGLYLYWRIYNANGRIEKPPHDMSVFDAYPQYCKTVGRDKAWNFKSFVNVKKCHKDNNLLKSVHEIKNGVNTMHLQTAMVNCYHKAHINHYFTKSFKEWIYKIIMRKDIYAGNRKFDEFFEYNPDMLYIKNELCDKYGMQVLRFLNKFVILNNEYAINIMSKCGSSTLGYLAYAQNFPDDKFLTKGEDSIHKYDFINFNSSESPKNNYHQKIEMRCWVDIEKIKKCGYKKVAIFRDPIERLLSARNPLMFSFNLSTNEDFFTFVGDEIKKPIGCTDQHVIPQSCFYNFDDIDIFVELKDLENWLVSIGCEPIRLNQTPHGRYEDATDDIKKWMPQLLEYYKDDFALIEKIRDSGKVWHDTANTKNE